MIRRIVRRVAARTSGWFSQHLLLTILLLSAIGGVAQYNAMRSVYHESTGGIQEARVLEDGQNQIVVAVAKVPIRAQVIEVPVDAGAQAEFAAEIAVVEESARKFCESQINDEGFRCSFAIFGATRRDDGVVLVAVSLTGYRPALDGAAVPMFGARVIKVRDGALYYE